MELSNVRDDAIQARVEAVLGASRRLTALGTKLRSDRHRIWEDQDRRVPLLNPLKELARSKPSDVMSRYSISA